MHAFRELAKRNLPFGHHDVEIDDYRHDVRFVANDIIWSDPGLP